jgi:predicted permease
VRARLDAMLERLEETPRVQAAGVVTFLPLTDGWGYYRYPIEGRPPEPSPEQWVVARPQLVSAGYLEAMGLRLTAGRWLDGGDRAESTPVVVVNEEFARRFLANEDPLSHRLIVGDRATAIVGVVGDVRQAGARDALFPEIYLPHLQIAIVPEQVSLVIRTEGDPWVLLPALREIVGGVDPGLPLADAATMKDRVTASVGQPRFYSRTLGLFAGVALCLAASGVYGVLAFEISRRRRELGIRRALGASHREIVLLMLRRGSRLVAIGLAAGIASSLALSRTFASLLFGIAPTHLPTFLAVVVIVGSVALLACYLPARRAARGEPAEVLRSE